MGVGRRIPEGIVTAPLRPPLAVTHGCVGCPDGQVIGRARLCPACRAKNKKRSNENWTANRGVVLELRRAVEEFARRLEAVEAQLKPRQRIRGISK